MAAQIEARGSENEVLVSNTTEGHTVAHIRAGHNVVAAQPLSLARCESYD